jgi:hypothetical protein
MMNQGVYPNLKDGTTQVTYSAGNMGALDLTPDLWSSASANSTAGYVQKVADSGNVTEVFYGAGSTLAYQASNSSALQLVYKITVPPQLAASGATWREIHAAVDCGVHVTPSGSPYGRIEVSSSASGPWTQIGNYAPPIDNELSSFWAYGRSGAAPLGGTTYYVRYTSYNGGYTSSIRYLRLFATYSLPASGSATIVTYSWNNGSAQTNTHTVAAGAASDAWSISTGTVASQTKVAISVPSGGAPLDSDGDGMTDAFENAHGFDPFNADQDGNGVLDGNDDWDSDGILNKNDATPGTAPAPPAPPAPAGGKGGGGGGCGLLGLEVLILWLLRRERRQGSWRRTNGRRWVLDS